jgi:hypothetical protein
MPMQPIHRLADLGQRPDGGVEWACPSVAATWSATRTASWWWRPAPPELPRPWPPVPGRSHRDPDGQRVRRPVPPPPYHSLVDQLCRRGGHRRRHLAYRGRGSRQRQPRPLRPTQPATLDPYRQPGPGSRRTRRFEPVGDVLDQHQPSHGQHLAQRPAAASPSSSSAPPSAVSSPSHRRPPLSFTITSTAPSHLVGMMLAAAEDRVIAPGGEIGVRVPSPRRLIPRSMVVGDQGP